MPGRTERIPFRGGLVCSCIAASFASIEQHMIAAGIIKHNIDVFQWCYRSDVAASAGTHDRGGVIDTGQYSDAALKIWRQHGVLMQHRTPAQGFIHHAHGMWHGCPHMSSGLAYQDREYLAGRNGLISRGPVTGPHVPVITWQAALAKYAGGAAGGSGGGGPQPREDEFTMGTPIDLRREKLPQKAPAHHWTTVQFGETAKTRGDSSLAIGARDRVQVTNCTVSFDDLTGQSAWARFVLVTTDSTGHKPKYNRQFKAVEISGTAGSSARLATWDGRVPKGQRLRLEINPQDHDCTITGVMVLGRKS